jgi:hypothetical protein
MPAEIPVKTSHDTSNSSLSFYMSALDSPSRLCLTALNALLLGLPAWLWVVGFSLMTPLPQVSDRIVIRCLQLVAAVLACPAYRSGRKSKSEQAASEAGSSGRPLPSSEQVQPNPPNFLLQPYLPGQSTPSFFPVIVDRLIAPVGMYLLIVKNSSLIPERTIALDLQKIVPSKSAFAASAWKKVRHCI